MSDEDAAHAVGAYTDAELLQFTLIASGPTTVGS